MNTVLFISGLKSGVIDIALTTEARVGKAGETLRSDRLVWAGAPNWEACWRDPLPLSLGADACGFRPTALAALKKVRQNWLSTCEISNMEPVRATLEADLAIAPVLRHSVPDSLHVIPADAKLPKLPMFQINLYQAENLSPAAEAFTDCIRHAVATA